MQINDKPCSQKRVSMQLKRSGIVWCEQPQRGHGSLCSFVTMNHSLFASPGTIHVSSDWCQETSHTHHTLTHTHRVMLLQIWRGNRNREHFTYLSLKTYFKLHECVPSEWGWVIIPDKAVNLQYKNCWLQIFTSEITQHQRPETGRHQKDKWSRDFDCFQCRGFMLLFDPVYIHFCAETQSVYSSPAPAPTPHPPHPRLKLVHFHLSCWGIQVIKGNEFSGIIISLAAQRSLLSADCALQTILNLFRT